MIYKTLHRKTKIKQHSPTKNRGWTPDQVLRNGDLIDWLIVGVLTPHSAISWRPVLVVEEAGVPGENHRPWASNCSEMVSSSISTSETYTVTIKGHEHHLIRKPYYSYIQHS